MMLIVRLLSHLQLTGSLHIFTVIFTFTIQDEGHLYLCHCILVYFKGQLGSAA